MPVPEEPINRCVGKITMGLIYNFMPKLLSDSFELHITPFQNFLDDAFDFPYSGLLKHVNIGQDVFDLFYGTPID